MSSEILDALWVEKYRPKSLDKVVLEPEDKKILQRCLDQGEVPHILFIGPAGSGKTTTARILNDYIIKNDMDFLPLNGSNTTGIETVRKTIEPFLKSPAFASKHKIVFIDEFDYMTSNAQADLRNIFERYSETGRFICTANYKSKIIDPLHSRFQTFEMKTISKEFALEYCTNILDTEGIKYKAEDVELVVECLIPDVRKVVNTLQRNVVDGKLQGVDKSKITTIENKIVGLVCLICDSIGKPTQDKVINQKVPDILTVLNEGEPEYYSVYNSLFNGKIEPWAKIVVNKYCNTHNGCVVPSMHFMSMIWEMIMTGNNYHEMFGKK